MDKNTPLNSASLPPLSGPLFLAAGQSGARLFSNDGKTWKNAQFGKEGEVYRAASFGLGNCVVIGTFGGNNILSRTRDGKTWETTTNDAKHAHFVRGMGFGGSTFVAVGGDAGSVGSSKPFTLLSADGKQWSDTTPIAGKNILRRLAFGNGLFVGVGDRGRRAASKDGKEWTDAPEVKAIDTLVDIAFGNGQFVGVGLHGLRMRSADGVKWTDRQVGEEGEHLNSIIFAKDHFVAVGAGATYTSVDGAVWQKHKNTNAPLTAAYGNGMYVGASWRGRLLHSSDGVAWQDVHKIEHHLETVAFGQLGA